MKRKDEVVNGRLYGGVRNALEDPWLTRQAAQPTWCPSAACKLLRLTQ